VNRREAEEHIRTVFQTRVADQLINALTHSDRMALDSIARAVAPDEDGTWTDADGKLESIGNIIHRTGRTIENWNT